jgi:hypothetical protein
MDRQTDGQTGRWTDRQMDRLTEGQTERHMNRKPKMLFSMQKDRGTDLQTDRSNNYDFFHFYYERKSFVTPEELILRLQKIRHLWQLKTSS